MADFFKIPKSPIEGIDLPIIDSSSCKELSKIGRSSFADVCKIEHAGSTKVIKELHGNDWDAIGGKFLKKANIMKIL